MKTSKPKSIQITIPKPCHEDWNKMTPQEQGRFCDSCQKCVVDFTRLSDKDVYQYFVANKDGKTCGRFRADQLNRKVFTPTTRRKYYQWFISLGFIVFLNNLLSTEVKAQEPIKYEQTIDKEQKKNGGTLVGRIYDEDNTPLANADILLLQGGINIVQTNTDKDGNYVIKYLAPGRYDLHVTKTGLTTDITRDIIISPKKHTEVNVKLHIRSNNNDIIIKEYKAPLIDKHARGNTITCTGGATLAEEHNLIMDHNKNMPQNKGSFWDWLRGIKHD